MRAPPRSTHGVALRRVAGAGACAASPRHASDSLHLVTLLLVPRRRATDHDGVESEKSFDPDSAGFVGDASLSEKSYDPDSAGFLRYVGGCWWVLLNCIFVRQCLEPRWGCISPSWLMRHGARRPVSWPVPKGRFVNRTPRPTRPTTHRKEEGSDDEKSFDASEDSFDPDQVPDDDDAASAASFDPERAGSRLASEKSFDPDRDPDDEQDLSGFDDEQRKDVATISVDVAHRVMADLNSTAKAELQKLRTQVEELTRAKTLLKGSLQESEEAKAKLKDSHEKMLVDAKQKEATLKAQLADAISKLAHASSSIESLQHDTASQQQQLATAHARGKELECKLQDATEQLEKETRLVSAEKERAAKDAEAAENNASKLKAQVTKLEKENVELRQQLSAMRSSLESESQDRGKVSEERGRLEQELAEARQHYQQLIATVNSWVSWRGSITSEVAKLKESQSDLLTVVDPALEARLAVSFQSPGKAKQASAQKPTLEHLPSAIAQAIKDDDDVTQAVEENLALLIAMANSAKAAVEKTLRDNEESVAEMQQDSEAKIKELKALHDAKSASLAEGSDALKAEQAAHAGTSKALKTAQTQLEAEAASLASTKKELSEAATRRDALEKELQSVKKQVQSLEAHVQELASKSTQLEGALKTEQEAHRDTDKAYKDAEKKGNALQKNVAALQQELDDAKKAAEDTRASLGGEASQLSDSLDKARAELRELALDRDSLSDKAKVLTEKKVHNSKSFPEYIH